MSPELLVVGDLNSIHVRRLVTALHDLGMDLEVAGFEGQDISEVQIHRLGRLPAAADRRYLLGVPRLARVLRQRRPTVINAHYLTSFGLMAAAARRLANPAGKLPGLIQTTWGDDLLVTPVRSRVQRLFARYALRAADLATGDSDDLRLAASSLAPAVPWERLVFGPPARLLHAPVHHEAVILSARQLVPEMRVGRIIQAFQVASRAPSSSIANWKLVVAGGGPEAGRLVAQAARDPLVEFTGWLSQRDLHDLMLRAAVVVSIPESDATSATLLESLAAGAVPIVNDLPANREWVSPQIGQVVSRDPSIPELADAIKDAASRSIGERELRAGIPEVTWEAQVHGFARSIHRLATSVGRTQR